jgi:poly-gamma-glutamate capsule biosynthesis protein CapA/YwtB (metallophosphatase superfamily)
MFIKIFLVVWFLVWTTQSKAFQADSLGEVRILAAGDVMLGSWIDQVTRSKGWNYPFVQLDSIVNQADIFFCNLEAPFGTNGAAFEKTYTFRVSPDLVQILAAGRINIVSLANNHMMDYGGEPLQTTIELLDKNNIYHSGAGLNLQEARKPARLAVKGKNISVACYSLTFPEEFWATDTSVGTCFPSHSFVFRDFKKFKSDSSILVVSFHWGGELQTMPKEYQIALAHQVIDAGADLIIGHHPHVIQGIEIYRGKVIAYSLGNFIFGSYSESAKEGMLLEFWQGAAGIEKCRIYPLLVYNREVEFQPRLLVGESREKFFTYLQEISRELNPQPLVINDAGWLELKTELQNLNP